MRFLHLSDLHVGKRLHEISMLDEQKAIFEQIIAYLRGSPVDAVIIAGDIYDKSVPSESAVTLFSDFLEKLSELDLPILMISGNHDSPERLSFAAGIMKKHKIYFVTDIKDSLTPVTLCDEYGSVNFYLLPYMCPSDVRNVFGECFDNHSQAVSYMTEKMAVDASRRNVIVSHQFVSGGAVIDSETHVGGLESVSAEAYKAFDYAALGHLHTPQNIGNKAVRYCGTPLKYSESEVRVSKSMTIVELKEKGTLSVETVPLVPIHDMIVIEGSVNELCDPKNATDKYVYAVVTDTNDVTGINAMLRSVYPNFVNLTFRFGSSDGEETMLLTGGIDKKKSPFEVFCDFYRAQHNTEMSELHMRILKEALEKEGGADNAPA